MVLTVISPATAQSNKIEVTAKSVYTTKNTVHADNGVVVYYDGLIIKSDQALYNKESKLLILDGHIEMIGYQNSKEYATHLELKTNTKEVKFKKLFLTSKNDVWLLSNQAHRIEGKYYLKNSMLSSCDINNPLWTMNFKDSVYDSKAKYMKIYNAKVSFLDVPIFYTPYLAFSTNKDRSSGLLFPGLGYTETEGYLYEQPIYWAISRNMDLEVNPQIRTNRSVGGYATFRFADSNDSEGTLRVGYFKDNDSYIAENRPKSENHYGVEFNYESNSLFKSYLPEDYTDELYINTTYLNDIDYINLQKKQLGHFGIHSLQESRVNYFVHNNNYYSGINAKYFIDTRLNSNDETLQILPSFHWHKYLKNLVWKNLTYSSDIHFNNITRKKGSTLKQVEARVPFEYSTSFFDEYVNLALTEEFYYSKYFFGNKNFKQDNFQYYNNIHKAKIFTDLSKKYGTYTHVMLPAISYVRPGSEKESPVSFKELEKSQKELFSVGLNEEIVDLSFTQYLYNGKASLEFFQRLSQKYYPTREYKWDDINNEVGFNIGKWNFYNNIMYSTRFNALRSISSDIRLKENRYKISLRHNYGRKLSDTIKEAKTNNLDVDLNYNYNDRISVGGGVIYDILKSASKQWAFGVGYHRDCWNIDASLRRDIRPTSRGKENLTSFYFQLNFIPFGGVGLTSTPEDR